MSLFESVTTKSLLYGGTSLVSSTVKKDLPKHLEYGQCLRLLLDIGAQIENLKENRIGILYITKNDIEAINNGYKLKADINTYPCDSNGEIKIISPFSPIEGMAPELKNINIIPSKVSYTVAYFSLKNLAINLLGIDNLDQLYPTKMYFLLERCSNENPEDRSFILI